MAKQWNADELMALVRGFHPACVIIAAAELDVFTILRDQSMDALGLAGRIKSDPRATATLLDALAAMGLLSKREGAFAVSADVAALLAEDGDRCMLGMVRHMGNCLRRWGQLAKVVMTGRPVEGEVSVRGAAGDVASFIRAMHEISDPVSPRLIESLGPLTFSHLLDLGGGSGTWTIPFLRRYPKAKATIFDLPEVIPMATALMKRAGLADCVRLVPGSFYADELPTGADLAWVSAIVHQNSREQNRAMFGKLFAALAPGGRILIRDIVMDESRTSPPMGAFFAVNMLVATPGGGTFTFSELRADLEAQGFIDARILRRGEEMDSVICATKPV
jgi:O-methyltransferase domain/Dimerisation domain